MTDRLSCESSSFLSASCKIPDPPVISLWGGPFREGDTVLHTADGVKKSIGLVQLNKLQNYFGVSEFGDLGIELGGDTFIDVLGRILMESDCRTTSNVLVQQFRQIDADANGNVDWSELCSFMSSSSNRDQHHSHGGPSRIRQKHQNRGKDNLARNTTGIAHISNVECVTYIDKLHVWIIGCQDSTIRVMDNTCQTQLHCINVAGEKGSLVAQLVGNVTPVQKPANMQCLGKTTVTKPFKLKTENAAIRRDCTWVLHIGYMSRSNLIVVVQTGGSLVFVSPETWTVFTEARPMRGARLCLGTPTSLLCFEAAHQVRSQGFRMVQRRLHGDMDDDSAMCDWLIIGDDYGVLYTFVFGADWKIQTPTTGSTAGTLTWHNIYRAACRVHFPRNHLVDAEDLNTTAKGHFQRNHVAMNTIVAHTKRSLQSNYMQKMNHHDICAVTSITFEQTLGCIYTTSDDTTIKNIDITKLIKDELLPSSPGANGGQLFPGHCFDRKVVLNQVYVEPGCVRKVITLHNSPVHTLILSQDHKFNVSASSDGVILVWDSVNSQLLHCIEDTLDTPRWIFLTADAQKLVSLSSGKALKIWQIYPDVTSLFSDTPSNRNGGQQGFLSSYTSPTVKVTAAAFHSGSNRLCLGSRHLKVMQIEFANLITTNETTVNYVEAQVSSADHENSQDEDQDSEKNTFGQIDKAIEAFSIPIGTIMSNRIGGIHNYVSTKRKNLTKIDTNTASSRLWKVTPGALPLVSVIVNRSFGQVITADTKGYIRLFDIATGILLYCFDSGLRVSTIALDSNERRILVGAQDGSLVMLNVANGQILTKFVNEDNENKHIVSKDRYIISILYSTSHRHSNAPGSVIVATPGMPLFVWTLNPGENIQSHMRKFSYTRAATTNSSEAARKNLSGHTDDIIQVISCDELVATVGADGVVFLIKIESSVPHAKLSMWPRRLFELKMPAHSRNHCATYLKAYDSLLVAGADGVLRMYNCANGTVLFEKHLGCVRSNRVNQRYYTTLEDDMVEEPPYQGTLDIVEDKVYPSSEQITCMSVYEGCLDILYKLHTQGHYTTTTETRINTISVEKVNNVETQNNANYVYQCKTFANETAASLVNRAYALGVQDNAAQKFRYNAQTSKARDSLAFLYAFPPPKYELAYHVQTIEEKYPLFKHKKKLQEQDAPSKVRADLPPIQSEPNLLIIGDSGGWVSVWDLSALDLTYCAHYSRWVNTVLERSMSNTLTTVPVLANPNISIDTASNDGQLAKKQAAVNAFTPDGVAIPGTCAASISNNISTLSHLSGNHELCGYSNKTCNGMCAKPNANSSVCAAMYPSGRVNPGTFNMMHEIPLFNDKKEPAVYPHVADPMLPLMYPPFPQLMPLVIRFQAHQGNVMNAEWIPHLRLIFTASGDGDVALWTLDGTRVGTFHPTGGVPHVGPSTNEKQVTNSSNLESNNANNNKKTSSTKYTQPESARHSRKLQTSQALQTSHTSSDDPESEKTNILDLGDEINTFAKQVEVVFGLFTTETEASKGPFDVYQRNTWLNYQAEIVPRNQDLEYRTTARVEDILKALTYDGFDDDGDDDEQIVFSPVDQENVAVTDTTENRRSHINSANLLKRSQLKKQGSFSKELQNNPPTTVIRPTAYDPMRSAAIDNKIAELLRPRNHHAQKHAPKSREELSLYDMEPVPQWDDLMNIVRYK